jgi:hypothetical protein
MHFLRGFIGKRRRENIVGPHRAAFDQIRDAMREHTGFAAARARENERRAVFTSDGAALFRVERF